MPVVSASPGGPAHLPTLSAEVKHVLDAPPTWVVRQGSGLLLLGIVLLLGLALLGHYPRAIQAQAVLGAAARPLAISLPAGATGCELRVRPGQLVQAGQLLALVRQGAAEQALAAPLAGTVAVASPGSRAVLWLLPTAAACRSRLSVPARDGELLQPGQKVLVSLKAFPSERFGQLAGVVGPAIGRTEAGQVTFALQLAQGYRSTRGLVLPVRGAEEGAAQVIVADKSLLTKWLRKYL